MLSQTQLRRDPHRKGKGIPASDGFTVIELMLVLVVVGSIVALALPSYSTVLEKRQVTSGAEQLSAFLSTAQLEAVKRNENI
ncbi:MAG: prepilin-type N-terminal cleavage/methylation domain-containing protein, partial [Proteobacteria bacterium]|nr:prepilin-type N-terminal cleavage/methylation domain-containing protein [Pseudomonadota bacterium]